MFFAIIFDEVEKTLYLGVVMNSKPGVTVCLSYIVAALSATAAVFMPSQDPWWPLIALMWICIASITELAST